MLQLQRWPHSAIEEELEEIFEKQLNELKIRKAPLVSQKEEKEDLQEKDVFPTGTGHPSDPTSGYLQPKPRKEEVAHSDSKLAESPIR